MDGEFEPQKDHKLDQKLERLTRMVEEDHKMIRSLYTRARITSVLRIIYLIVIIGAAVGAYYFIQPYLEKLVDVYNSIKSTQTSLENNSVADWFGIIKNSFQNATSSSR